MRNARTAPSGTAMTVMPAAMMTEFSNASQKSESAKMNANAPRPSFLSGEKNGALSRLW
jgi:hypothetical protein